VKPAIHREGSFHNAEKGRLAVSVADLHSKFDEAFAENRRKYPTSEFRSFAAGVRRYVEKTESDEMMHRGSDSQRLGRSGSRGGV
jgi:hypothetical protein